MKAQILALALTTLISHGAVAGVFSDYSGDASTFRTVMGQPLSADLQKNLDKKIKSSDKVLYLLEKARLLQANKEYEASQKTYAAAFELIDEQENKAKVSAGRLGSQALSLISNETMIAYVVPDYEKVLAHVLQAVNYMVLGNSEAASVEMRAAQAKQRDMELARQEQEDKAQEKADKQPTEEQTRAYEDSFKGLDPIVAQVKNTYQNAYSFYMGAVLWESLGEMNDALVDYKKAYQLQPDPAIQADIQRVEKAKKSTDSPVVVLIEQGLVPNKQTNQIALPTVGGIVNAAFASYDPSTYTAPKNLKITSGTKNVQTFVLSNTGALAVKSLKERAVSDMSRQIMRTVTKYAAQQQVGSRFGFLGQIATNLYNTASDKADLRAWSTLPSNTQVGRLQLAAGEHTLQLSGQHGEQSIPIQVEQGKTTVVHVIDHNGQLTANAFNVASATSSMPR